MKYALTVFLISSFLFACSSQPDYQRAVGNGYGYKESQLSDSQYRIHFKARRSDKALAMDYAMLRAAELTLLKGYDWFRVTDRETILDEKREPQTTAGFSQRYRTVRSCGLISCTSTTYPTSQIETGIFIGGVEKSEIESIVMIEMGQGETPQDATVFNAQQVRDNLSPEDAAGKNSNV